MKLVLDKIRHMQSAGIRDFSLFFDDIRVPITRETAIEQSHIANRVYGIIRERDNDGLLFFCPTQYRGFPSSEYIKAIADELTSEICIFWTGKRVVSWKISVKDVERITAILKRPPLIWDNQFANDYIPGVILRHPYRYREPGIVSKVRGILLNPMNQYVQSKALIYTAAKFFNDPFKYVPRKAWKQAMSM
jgi:protein O-GlcNAcase/histone acetyltransferase